MKTYPIFRATFSGSCDHMAHVDVSVAATNITQAIKKFREWDSRNTGLCGTVGKLIYPSERFGWVRPETITREHIRRVTDTRATRKDWFATH